MSRPTLDQCETGQDFIDHARYHPSRSAVIRNGHGSHVVVKTPKGATVVPAGHRKDLGKGLRAKLVKAFREIGLPVLVIGLPIGAFIAYRIAHA